MKIIYSGRYKCPYCGTVVELEEDDIKHWWEVEYYECPTCKHTPHIKGGSFWCPRNIEGKKAIRL